jgi:hypothetical protein
MNTVIEKNLQIDILPIKDDTQTLKLHLYVDGICYTMHTSDYTISRMIADGLIKQVQGERHNEKFELEPYDYPTGVDSAGVKYTSVVYAMKQKH